MISSTKSVMTLISVLILASSALSSIGLLAFGGSKESLPSSRATRRVLSMKPRRTL